jgi:anti-sigma B factor antagonist
MTLIMLPERGDGVRLLCASGELDVAVVPAMLPGVPDLVAAARGVVLDLSDVTFFDSSGVRLVDRMSRECGRADTPLRVVAPPGTPTRRVLELVGLIDDLVTDDVPAALIAVRPAS